MLPRKPWPLGSAQMSLRSLGKKVQSTQMNVIGIHAAQEALAPEVSTDAVRHLGQKIQSTQINVMGIHAAQEALAPGVSTDAVRNLRKNTIYPD